MSSLLNALDATYRALEKPSMPCDEEQMIDARIHDEAVDKHYDEEDEEAESSLIALLRGVAESQAKRDASEDELKHG